MRWIVCGACNHSICICVRGGMHATLEECGIWFCRGENAMRRLLSGSRRLPTPRRLRNHLRVVTSTHVCIVADIIVHNHEMMMSWCAQSRWMLGATLLFILLLFEACFVGAWLLGKKKKKNRTKSCQTFSPSCWQEQCRILSMEEKRISHPYTPTRQVG